MYIAPLVELKPLMTQVEETGGRRLVVQCAVACAELALPHVETPLGAAALEATSRWTRDEATDKDVLAAMSALQESDEQSDAVSVISCAAGTAVARTHGGKDKKGQSVEAIMGMFSALGSLEQDVSGHRFDSPEAAGVLVALSAKCEAMIRRIAKLEGSAQAPAKASKPKAKKTKK